MIEGQKTLAKEDLYLLLYNAQKDNEKLTERVLYLEYQIDLFRKQFFGKKSEQHLTIVPAEQTRLDLDSPVDLDLSQDIAQQQITYNRRIPKKQREDFSKLELPEHLERVITVIEPEGKTVEMVKVSEEVTELLAITPQKFFVKRIIRPKYALPNKGGIIIADLPSRPLQGGMVDVSLLVIILLDKYVDHLPIYRQLKKYERLGVKLSDSTVGNWVAGCLKLLEILYNILVEHVKKCNYLQVDETTIKVLDKQKKLTTHLGYYWLYHDVGSGLVLYEYNSSRGKEAPSKFLNDFDGYLQSDGYAVYDVLSNTKLKLSACMAHARRKFHEAIDHDKKRANWMLDKMQLLYAIESRAREEQLSQDARSNLRREQSIPVLEEMKIWLNENCMQVVPKSPIGKAIQYMLVRWEKFLLYAQTGILEIDNNLIENAVRPVAIGRKNYLFAGSHEAAKRAGIIYSFITCCKKNGYDPYKWLEETLTKLPDTKTSELYKLLPIKKQDVL